MHAKYFSKKLVPEYYFSLINLATLGDPSTCYLLWIDDPTENEFALMVGFSKIKV
jgi:hypothetical protein